VLLSINCMSLASPAAVFARILARLSACSGSPPARPGPGGGRRASMGGAEGFLRPGLVCRFERACPQQPPPPSAPFLMPRNQ
jgi:hypothetical protein